MLARFALMLFASSLATALPSGSAQQSPAAISGEASYFPQNGLPGACGNFHSDSDLIVAITPKYWGSSFNSALCGRQVNITNTNNNKNVVATIADECFTCVNDDSLDLSFGSFEAIADLSEGLVPVEWYII